MMFDVGAWTNWAEAAPVGASSVYGAGAALAASLVITGIAILRASACRKSLETLQHSLQASQRACERLQNEVDILNARFADPLSREQEVRRLEGEIEERNSRCDEVGRQIAALREDYALKRKIFEDLQAQAAVYDETIQLAEIGFYHPHFRFDDSEKYKVAIQEVKAKQKSLVKNKGAVIIGTGWSVGGSRQEGKKLETRTIRLTLRAFNNECDAAIANVTWRNSESMRKRIQKAFDQINKENEPLDARISGQYLDLKIKELQLTIDREEKRKKERDEAAELRRHEREEKKLREEAKQAEKEEREAEERLARARAQAEQAVGTELENMNAMIEGLRQQLEEAHARAERAQSMAEQTKMGHVYVISNRGSFGEEVFKIGLTRRLDPQDRIKELGDASVPFAFDTHALIFSEDAPALESALHTEFDAWRVNAANTRKEFFRITLDDVEQAVGRLAPEADFYRDAEAQEYHETLMLMQKQADTADNTQLFPATL